MTEDTEFCVVLTTTSSQAEADRLAGGLVSERLAACVQIVAINSHYIWEGKAQQEPEYLLLVKTRKEVYERIEAFIHREHSYEVPELIQLPVEAGSGPYLDWVRENTG